MHVVGFILKNAACLKIIRLPVASLAAPFEGSERRRRRAESSLKNDVAVVPARMADSLISASAFGLPVTQVALIYILDISHFITVSPGKQIIRGYGQPVHMFSMHA